MIRVLCQPFVFHTMKDIFREAPLFSKCIKNEQSEYEDLQISTVPSPELMPRETTSILNRKKSLIGSAKSKASQASHSLNESKNHNSQIRVSGNYKIQPRIKKKTNPADQDLNTFLNKAFNVEYVFLILTGIMKIMQAQSQKFMKFKQDQQKLQALEVAS